MNHIDFTKAQCGDEYTGLIAETKPAQNTIEFVLSFDDYERTANFLIIRKEKAEWMLGFPNGSSVIWDGLINGTITNDQDLVEYVWFLSLATKNGPEFRMTINRITGRFYLVCMKG